MAGNKPSSKIKGSKEERIKRKKNSDLNSNNESSSSSGSPSQTSNDLSVLCKSIPTSILGFREMKNAFESATEEVQNLLSNECDIIYECRVCRNMFRSLANFLSHKRIYCKQRFNATLHAHFVTTSFLDSDMTDICTNINNNNDECNVRPTANSSKKDLISIINKLENEVSNKKLGLTEYYDEISYRAEQMDALKSEHAIRLDPIESNKSAVYQTVVKRNDIDTNNEFILDEVIELHDMLWQGNAVMGPDGKLLETDSSGQIIVPKVVKSKSSDDEDQVLKCDICSLEFKTRKTLLYHMKVRHTTSHTHYPCPSCEEIFPTAGSVYRHLCKVHNNTMVTIRKLREQILNKGFTMDNASKRMLNRMNKKEESVAKPETQDEVETWSFDFQHDVDAFHCKSCNRKFERKAALTSHQLICKNRGQAQNKCSTNTTKKTDDEKVIKPIRKLKVPIKKIKSNTASITQKVENNIGTQNIEEIKVESDTIEAKNKESHESSDTENEANKTDIDSPEKQNNFPNDNEQNNFPNDNDQIIHAPANSKSKTNRRKRARNGKRNHDAKENSDMYWEMNEQESMNVKRIKNETSDEEEMKKKMIALINEKKMQCIPCKKVFPSMTNLKRHIALHMKWKRFQCGLCWSQFYHRSECLYHLGRSHNMDDKNIADTLVLPIHHNESEDIVEKINMEQDHKNEQSDEKPKDNMDITIDEVILKSTVPENDSTDPLTTDEVNYNSIDLLKNKEIVKEIHHQPVSPNEETKDENSDSTPTKRRGRPKLLPSEKIPEEDSERRGRGRPKGSINKEKKEKIKKSKKQVTDKSKLSEKKNQSQNPEEIRKMVLEVIFGGDNNDEIQEEKSDELAGEIIANEKSLDDQCEKLIDIQYENEIKTPSSPETDASCVSTDFEIKTKIDNALYKKSSRPVRNRVKVINKDFVYDLSDLLKKEAVAYKENQYTNACNRFKKKPNSGIHLDDKTIKTYINVNNENDIIKPVVPYLNPPEFVDVNIFDNMKSISGNTENDKPFVNEDKTSSVLPQSSVDSSFEDNNDCVEDITVIPVNISSNSADESSSSCDEMPVLEVNTVQDDDSNYDEMNQTFEDSDLSSDSDSLCPDITENIYKPNGTDNYLHSDLTSVIKLQQNMGNRVYIRKSTGDLEEVIFEAPGDNNIYEPIINNLINNSDEQEDTSYVSYNDHITETLALQCDSTLEESSSEDEIYDSDQ